MDREANKEAFETCDVEIRMTGRSGSEHVLATTRRRNVTPPEFIVLQEMHGIDNVTFLGMGDDAMEFVGFRDVDDGEGGVRQEKAYQPRSESAELDRLRSWYGPRAVDKIYSGRNPRLPLTFAEARIHTTIPDNVREMGKRASRQDVNKKLTGALGGGKE